MMHPLYQQPNSSLYPQSSSSLFPQPSSSLYPQWQLNSSPYPPYPQAPMMHPLQSSSFHQQPTMQQPWFQPPVTSARGTFPRQPRAGGPSPDNHGACSSTTPGTSRSSRCRSSSPSNANGTTTNTPAQEQEAEGGGAAHHPPSEPMRQFIGTHTWLLFWGWSVSSPPSPRTGGMLHGRS